MVVDTLQWVQRVSKSLAEREVDQVTWFATLVTRKSSVSTRLCQQGQS
jgi:hypothetical protein